MIPLDDEFDPNADLLKNEAVCACHNLSYNRFLGACPIAVADAPTPWSPR